MANHPTNEPTTSDELMTQTDRLLVAITAEVERHRAALDADEFLSVVELMIKLNAGGIPCLVEMDRRTRKDLTESRPR